MTKTILRVSTSKYDIEIEEHPDTSTVTMDARTPDGGVFEFEIPSDLWRSISDALARKRQATEGGG